MALGAAINVGVTYFTNSNATTKDYVAAAASGAIAGSGVGLGLAGAATANVLGGIVGRSISGKHNSAGQEAISITKDAIVGAVGEKIGKLGGSAGTRIAKAINGKDSEMLGKAAGGAHLGARHSASLSKQAAAAASFEGTGKNVGGRAGDGVGAVATAREARKKEQR
jgi:hypothetical protein